jgi:uncharacterized protein YgbK (DUF1537 family)
MSRLRILADDLTGALDCAAAFGAGVPVHLGQPASATAPGLDVVATATRDVDLAQMQALLAPCLPWLQRADIAFKKVDSLLRGNTLDEVDWLARQGGFQGLVMAPAFPSQGRVTRGGQQWWVRPGQADAAVGANLADGLRARGWTVHTGAERPQPDGALNAWIPEACADADLDRIAGLAARDQGAWLWCGSAGLAQALARQLPLARCLGSGTTTAVPGPLMLVSASHHAVSRGQWQRLRQSPWAGHCQAGVAALVWPAADQPDPLLLDLCAPEPLSPQQAAHLLAGQAATIAEQAPRPRTLVVVGGDTLLALCQALGARGLQSDTPLARSGWGCARMVGGRWDGVLCHSRSGAFGPEEDLVQVLDHLQAAH